MDAIQRFNKQTSSARVFFYRKLSQCTMNCVHMLVNSRLYDAIHAFRVCFFDDITITESTGIISSISCMSSDTFMLESYFNFRRTRGQRLYNLFVLTWL